MNWETIGWIAIAASVAIIIYNALVGPGETVADAGAQSGIEPPPPNAMLEIAWPVAFIATMAMITFKEIMDFAGVLLLATVLTGIIWLVDAKAFRRKRAGNAHDPVLVEMAKSFFPVILIVFLLRSFLYEPFKIPSGSMVPSLLVGDFILVNKYTYGVRIPVINKKVVDVNLPQRGDVMVFRYPDDPAKAYIKRVVGTPGDTVQYRNKRLIINGKPVETKAVGSYTDSDNGLIRFFDTFAETLGEKPHSMMTDPRLASINLGDVRQFPNRQNCEYNDDGMTCLVPAGNYFMMGDSRDNSLDGRYWGFVPEANIVGKAVLIWMNFGALNRMGKSIN